MRPSARAQISEIVRAWAEVERSTGPADRPAAEAGMLSLYRASGWRPPREIRWFDSPFGAVEAIVASQRGPALFAPGVGRFDLERLNMRRFPHSVWRTITESFSRAPRDRFKRLIDAAILARIPQAQAILARAACGQHDARWVSLYDVLDRVFELPEAEPMAGAVALSRACGWWWAYRETAFLCERQASLICDERGRPHCATGPALRFRDGHALYAFAAVAVDPWIVETPERITTALISAETNAEVRRVMIELFGPARYLEELGARVVATDAFGILYHAEAPGDEALAMVRVTNATPEPDGTRRIYHLRVPPGMRTPREAVAWTFGLPAHAYAPSVET